MSSNELYGHLYYLTLQAAPPPHELDIGGAYVSCWISCSDDAVAEAEARRNVRDEGWTPLDLVDCYPVERSAYLESDSLLYYDEADRDGACFVFHTYPED